MAKNRHVYLNNESKSNDGFRKNRNVQNRVDEEEIEVSKFPNIAQQDRLRKANAILFSERKQRREQRTIDLPNNIELISVRFIKVFNESLKKEFFTKYGLVISTYEDFNKTVLFEIANLGLFKNFIRHVEMYYGSSSNQTYQGKEYNLIALVVDFRFLTTKRRIKAYTAGTSSLNLIPLQNEISVNIYKALIQYLAERQKPIFQTNLSNEIIEIEDLKINEIEEIASNFDIVKTITSARTERRRPGAFGQERREYGFTVSIPDNLPTVGVIDTGMFPLEPLRSCISSVGYDLTNTAIYMDDEGHGTAVSSLVILGHEFIKNIKEIYEAKAKVAVIKAIQNNNDIINIVKLVEVIKEANSNHGIRLFNLSLNDPLPKGYNKSFSEYAYLLDKLAFEMDLLIFISVGNILEQRLTELIIEDPHVSHQYPSIFYSLDNKSEIHSCESTNISEPSESLNNLSIGALAGNLENILNSDITPAEEFPAYYTRKHHYDYEQQINGSEFLRSQKNKYLNKPDLVFEGGDLFKYEAGMEILRSPIEAHGNRFYSRSCGTSLATPLVTSLAAQILKEYPILRTQTVKAILLNSAHPPIGTYSNPPVPFRNFPINLFRKLTGFGRPNSDILVSTDNNSINLIIEGEIEVEKLETRIIQIPEYISNNGNKLNFRGTLCYSFLPLKDNHLAYLPLQITFGIFKPINADVMGRKDDKAAKQKGTQTSEYLIKNGMSWSDDFFGVENRLFSNVQQIDYNVSAEQIEALGNKVSLAIRSVCKNEIEEPFLHYLKGTKHKFSLVLRISELPVTRAENKLYQEMIAINSIGQIIKIDGEATIEAEL